MDNKMEISSEHFYYAEIFYISQDGDCNAIADNKKNHKNIQSAGRHGAQETFEDTSVNQIEKGKNKTAEEEIIKSRTSKAKEVDRADEICEIHDTFDEVIKDRQGLEVFSHGFSDLNSSRNH